MRIAVLLAATVGFPSAALAQSTVPLEIADGGYLYVHVRLADDVDARMLLDTGAGINTISEPLFQVLEPALKSAGTHTGTRHNGETQTGPIWSLSSIAMGAFRKTDVVVGRFAPQGADGLLSMDFFRDQPFTLDLQAGALTIESVEHMADVSRRATPIPIRLKPNGPHELDFFVRVCFGNGIEADAEFDTGAGFNMLMLHPSYMSRLGITADGPPRGELEYYLYSTFLPEMHYCAAPTVSSVKQFVGFKEGLIYEALVGHGTFRNRRLTIDLPGRRMLVW